MQGHDQGQLPGAVVAAGEPEFSSPLIRSDFDHSMVRRIAVLTIILS